MEFSYTYEEFEFPELEKVLKDMGAKMREFMRNRLENHKPYKTNASYGLSDSIQYLIEKDNQAYEVNISLADYWKYVENGTGPHWAPIKPLKEWVIVKPVLPTVTQKKIKWTLKDGTVKEKTVSYLPTVDQLAYAVKWKIHEKGTEAQPFFWNSVEDAVKEFEDRIEEALSKDMDRNVETILMTLKF